MSRRRYVYQLNDAGQVEAVEIFNRPDVEPRLQINTDSHYAGLQATDGTDISTRKRHREYMAANNLSLVSDWKETHAQMAKERALGMSHPKHKAARLEAIRRAYETKRGNRG